MAFDGALSSADLRNTKGAGAGGGFGGFRETGDGIGDAAEGWAGGHLHRPSKVGGIDYFVSSWLFEDMNLGRLAVRRHEPRAACAAQVQ